MILSADISNFSNLSNHLIMTDIGDTKFLRNETPDYVVISLNMIQHNFYLFILRHSINSNLMTNSYADS